MSGTLTVDEAVGSIVTLQRNDGTAERCMVGGIGGTSPLTPQPRALSIIQIIDPQNATGVATATGAETATVSDIAGTTYTGRVWNRFADLVNAWGTLQPFFTQGLHIVFASSHVDNLDPIAGFAPITADFVQFVGARPAGFATAALSNVAVKNRAPGANRALQAQGPVAPGNYIVNTTKGGVAWCHRLKTGSGTIFLVTQPLDEGQNNLTPAQVNSWHNGDAIDLFEPTAIYFASLGGVDASGDGAGDVRIYSCTLFDPSGVPGTTGSRFDCTSLSITLIECRIDCNLTAIAGNAGVLCWLVNCYVAGNYSCLEPATVVVGGMFQSFGSVIDTLDGDVIVYAPGAVLLGDALFACAMGFVCLDTSISLQGGQTYVLGLFYGGATIYASETLSTVNLDILNSGRLYYDPAITATVAFTYPLAISTGIGINGGADASNEDGGSPTVINGGIQTTVQNLDAPVGIGSFGGKAFVLGGGTIADFV